MGDRKFSSCSILEEDGTEFELRCPKCHCPCLLFHDDEVEEFTEGHQYLGKPVTCCECGNKFKVTENCWERTGERY
jgi:hypothetical protein